MDRSRMICLALLFYAVFCLNSCSPVSKIPALRIISDTLLTELPSGSGLVVYKNHLYVVGDDASGFFERPVEGRQFTFHPYETGDSLYRIEKTLKYDPECLALVRVDGSNQLIALGSGSGTSFRNNIYLIDPKTRQSQKFDGAKAYEKIRNELQIAEKDFNLEAAFARGNDLYIFNRGNNGIIHLKVNHLLNFLRQQGNRLPVKQTLVPLKVQAAGQPRFSGATALDSKHILFSASMEETTAWMQDGEVRGSFIGVIRQGPKGYEVLSMLALQKNGKFLIEKLESVDIAEKLPGKKYRLYAISDNDNGSTRLFELELF